MKEKLNILRCGDQNFWAYHWITKEHMRYTAHNMQYAKHDEINLDGVDVLYIHSPDITNYHADKLPLEAKARGIKVIGAYAGNPHFWSPAEKRTYSHADLIVTISPQTYSFAKFHYTNIPVIYMPESIDTEFFTPKSCNRNRFNVGWAGGVHKRVKRYHIAEELKYPIYLKDNWKAQRESQNKNLTLKEMKEYYRKIDVLLVTSASECQPRTVLEAMATGKPVISTDVGSVSMLLEPEWIVPINPTKKVVEEINFRLDLLKKYPKLRQRVGQRNLDFITKYFSWENNKVLWDTIFEDVYNGNIDNAIYQSKKFLIPFKKEFVSKFIRFTSINDESIKLLLEELKANCKFFLINESCKDAVIYRKNQSNKILLGVNNQMMLDKINDILKNSITYEKLNDKVIIKVKLNVNITKTKQMLFENTSIDVPYPVVPYLNNIFGTEWR